MEDEALLEIAACTSETTDCVSADSCNEYEVNCTCTPCEKNNIFVENTALKNMPLLLNKIFSCYTHKNTATSLGTGVPFQIATNPDCNYVSGSPICIDNITYSYSAIGATEPISFFFNNNINTFSPTNSISGNCEYDILGIIGGSETSAAIASAEETINLANAISSSDPIETQLSQIANVARSATSTNILATQAINTIAQSFFPENTRTQLQRVLIEISEATNAHARAENVISQILPDPTAADLTTAAANEKVFINQSNTLIEEAASIILNYVPTPSSTILSSANSAISFAEESNAAIDEAVATTPPTFIQLIPPLIRGVDALNSIIDSLGLLSQSTQQGATFISLLESMQIQTTAMFYSHLGIESSYDAESNVADPTAAQTYINTAIGYFITSSNLIIQSLDFGTTVQNISLFDTFESQTIKQNCCSASSNAIFTQIEPALSICNLQITLTGTIGDCPFTADYTNPNLLPLSITGYKPQDFGFYICAPCNVNFKLYETLNHSFAINCVIPERTYNTSTPNLFYAYISSTLCLTHEISVITKTSTAVIANDSLVCENSNN